MNKRRSTYSEISARQTRAMLSMRSGRWLPPSRATREGLLARIPHSSPAVNTPAGAALPETASAQPVSVQQVPEPVTASVKQQVLAEPVHGRSMVSVIVIAVAVTVLALSVLVGTEAALRALGRSSFISEFIGSPAANPGYIYNLILIAIAVLGASLGTAFLLVSAIIGVRLERRQGLVLGTDAQAEDSRAGRGASGTAVASRFAPPASAQPAQLFTQPGSLETAMR